MKTKYIMAIAALGSTLGIGLTSTAITSTPEQTVPQPQRPAVAPANPSSAVWDGFEYVGQVNGRYYYQGPNNTWLVMDQAHQQRFDEWRRNQAARNNPGTQSSQMQNTRSSGSNPNARPVAAPVPVVTSPAKGQNASAQSGLTQNQNMSVMAPVVAPAPSGSSRSLGPQGPAKAQNATAQTSQIQTNSSLVVVSAPIVQPNQTVTRSAGSPAKGQNASAQTSPVQTTLAGPVQTTPVYQGQEVGQSDNWNQPDWQSSQFRNTRYQGHDMGQTHPVAPPLPEKQQ